MTTTKIVQQLKENGCDYEYYPTTKEIVEQVALKMVSAYQRSEDQYKILDIGCGKGDFFEKFKEIKAEKEKGYDCARKPYKFFGIEKSPVLLEQLPDDVILLGTDFGEQTLIDKQMHAIFCNPPYSKMEPWAEKIIREGFAERIFLVLPERWKNSDLIKMALRDRGVEATVIFSSDFYDAERKARAKVDIIQIDCIVYDYAKRKSTDPFDLWFKKEFQLQADKAENIEEETLKKIKTDLVQTENIAKQLVSFYNADGEKVKQNYKKLETLDAELFKELNVNIDMLKKSLKERMSGLKSLYWHELFKRYDKITMRLTKESREKAMVRINGSAEIDFTLNNIFAVTLWVIRNANKMFDEQLISFFKDLTSEDTIKAYKSNKHWTLSDWRGKEGNWRFKQAKFDGKITHYTLDYRVIKECCGRHYIFSDCLSERTVDFLSDTVCIANNLGFDVPYIDFERNEPADKWSNNDILFADGKVFCNVRIYKNGNAHLKFDTAFMQKLNIEASRLLGWVTSKEECAEELEMNPAVVSQFWNCNKKLGLTDGLQYAGIEAPK